MNLASQTELLNINVLTHQAFRPTFSYVNLLYLRLFQLPCQETKIREKLEVNLAPDQCSVKTG